MVRGSENKLCRSLPRPLTCPGSTGGKPDMGVEEVHHRSDKRARPRPTWCASCRDRPSPGTADRSPASSPSASPNSRTRHCRRTIRGSAAADRLIWSESRRARPNCRVGTVGSCRRIAHDSVRYNGCRTAASRSLAPPRRPRRRRPVALFQQLQRHVPAVRPAERRDPLRIDELQALQDRRRPSTDRSTSTVPIAW